MGKNIQQPQPVEVITHPTKSDQLVTVDNQPVAAIREHWILEDCWWTDHPVAREYFELVTENGTVMTIYRDLRNGGWYAHQ